MKARSLFATLLMLTLLVSASDTPARSETMLGTDPFTFTALPAERRDDDHDGIDDALEQFLAERYAPVIYLEPGESNYPVSVEWMLKRNHLVYFEDCFGDENEAVPDAPNPLND